MVSVRAFGEVRYTVTDLGTLGGTSTTLAAINNRGQVVGSSMVADGHYHAFLWQAGRGMADLGVFPGTNGSQASDINDSGYIVGTAWQEPGVNYLDRAFGSDNGGPLQYLFANPATYNNEAYQVDNQGRVYGYTQVQPGPRTVGIWQEGGLVYAAPPDAPFSSAMNNHAQVVGYTPNIDPRATIWSPPGATQYFSDIGGPPNNWEYSFAEDINDTGAVVGSYWPTGGSGATGFLWRPMGAGGSYQDLCFPGQTASEALGINGQEDVVGYFAMSDGVNHAMLWTSEAGAVDLNTFIDPADGWTLTQARKVNDLGQIIGYATLDGQTRAVVLTPVPEPATLATLLAASLVLLAHRWPTMPRSGRTCPADGGDHK